MPVYLAEFIGTAILILLGNGVVANVVLNKTKGNDSGWIVITLGWGIAVFTAVFISTHAGGPGHLNPAVTIGLALTSEELSWGAVPLLILMQMLGAALGTTLAYLMYKPHYDATSDQGDQLATFATAPEIPSTFSNLVSEILGTFILVYGAFHVAGATINGQSASLGALDALPIGLVVLGIGLCLGGTTGYAINPARDLAPRIMHSILPIKGKGDSNWSYSWIPVVGPIAGAVIAALVKIYIG